MVLTIASLVKPVLQHIASVIQGDTVGHQSCTGRGERVQTSVRLIYGDSVILPTAWAYGGAVTHLWSHSVSPLLHAVI